MSASYKEETEFWGVFHENREICAFMFLTAAMQFGIFSTLWHFHGAHSVLSLQVWSPVWIVSTIPVLWVRMAQWQCLAITHVVTESKCSVWVQQPKLREFCAKLLTQPEEIALCAMSTHSDPQLTSGHSHFLVSFACWWPITYSYISSCLKYGHAFTHLLPPVTAVCPYNSLVASHPHPHRTQRLLFTSRTSWPIMPVQLPVSSMAPYWSSGLSAIE